jgi:hypothetical protein
MDRCAPCAPAPAARAIGLAGRFAGPRPSPAAAQALLPELPVVQGEVALPLVAGVEAQPLGAQVKRVAAALEYLGQPLPASVQAALDAALEDEDEAAAAVAIQRALDPHCLTLVQISAEGRVRAGVDLPPPRAGLVESGWSVFLVKVQNDAGAAKPLRIKSPNAASTFNSAAAELGDRWREAAAARGAMQTPLRVFCMENHP